MFVWDNAQNKQAFFFLHDDGPNLIKQHFYLITLDSITHSDTRFNVPGYAPSLNPTQQLSSPFYQW